MFHVGQTVICVWNEGSPLVLGRRYVVRGFIEKLDVRFVRVGDPNEGADGGWFPQRFAPVEDAFHLDLEVSVDEVVISAEETIGA